MPDDVFECHDPNGVPFSKTNNFVDRAWAMKKIKALEEENARLREALEWRPMETAPTDGTSILAVIDVYSASTTKFLRWEIHIIYRNACGDAVTPEGDDVGWPWEEFRCWKPIDLPPEPTDREGGKNG